MSEDCLTINVFRPRGTSRRDKLPVMVWVYGGAVTTGDTISYNPTGIISQGVNKVSTPPQSNVDITPCHALRSTSHHEPFRRILSFMFHLIIVSIPWDSPLRLLWRKLQLPATPL